MVGAVGESDRELLETVQRAHHELDLRRAYFSAFHPIERSPFADALAEDPTRAFMLRDYGFSAADMPFDEAGLLPRDRTPKQAWAERNLHEPIEINRASRAHLLKIPGIGPKSADRILAAFCALRAQKNGKQMILKECMAVPGEVFSSRRLPRSGFENCSRNMLQRFIASIFCDCLSLLR